MEFSRVLGDSFHLIKQKNCLGTIVVWSVSQYCIVSHQDMVKQERDGSCISSWAWENYTVVCMAALDTGIQCAQLSTFSSWETPKQKGSLKPEAKQNVALLHHLNFWVMWALYRWLGQQGSWGRSRKMVPSVIVSDFFYGIEHVEYWLSVLLLYWLLAFLPEYGFSFYYYLCLCVYKCRHTYAQMSIYAHIYTHGLGHLSISV